ncbi:MAG: cysteine peptidase family C39 domain-containing protein, partial [Porticoccaceae bacterium]|nr:cysteine peptidase family C39 domain-containing protein [Porticoccaceae bacterium]
MSSQQDKTTDTGLYSLALIAQIHQIAVDSPQLKHQFGQDERPFSTADILRAAKSLGFKAKTVESQPNRLNPKILPAIGQTTCGRFFVIARITEQEGEGEPKVLIQECGKQSPTVLTMSQLQEHWAGDLILLTPRNTAGVGKHSTFNLSWFIPSLVKYRKLFGEVVVVSFFLQLFALVTPLFFQVVMDKVLVHKGFTTLDVLAFGFVVVALFDALLGGLRTYLFSHTTNR